MNFDFNDTLDKLGLWFQGLAQNPKPKALNPQPSGLQVSGLGPMAWPKTPREARYILGVEAAAHATRKICQRILVGKIATVVVGFRV